MGGVVVDVQGVYLIFPGFRYKIGKHPLDLLVGEDPGVLLGHRLVDGHRFLSGALPAHTVKGVLVLVGGKAENGRNKQHQGKGRLSQPPGKELAKFKADEFFHPSFPPK